MTRKRIILSIAAVAVSAGLLAGFQAAKKAESSGDPLIDGFKKTTVASVADAVDQITGTRGFLSHKIRPVVAGQVVGRAITSLVRPAPPERATPSLAVKHSTEMIDNANPGEVGIIVMEDGADVAAIGGLMGTAAKARGMAGIVIDGGVRDVAELRGLELPVYASSITPATAVSRWASVGNNIPVRCGDVMIHPGDIIVAGEDGLVAVPNARAAEVLKRAREIDERETKMVPLIKQYKSLTKVVQMFNRI
jgi:regulator of RNase E activity RraA